MSKLEILENEKTPVSKHKYVGVEIEFISPWKRRDISSLLIKHDLQNNCCIKGDGSIQDEERVTKPKPEFKHVCKSITYDPWENYCKGCREESDWEDDNTEFFGGHELTILSTESELRGILKTVHVVLKEIRAEVNSSCGLHVHLDMRNRNLEKCVVSLLEKQKEFHKMVSKNRLKGTYCKPLTVADIKRKNRDRYKDINMTAYEKFGTVEIRVHEGTVNTTEIYNWCKYLTAIVDKKKVSKAYVKKRTLECA